MKIVYNKIIPFSGYVAMSIFPFIFVRKDASRITTNVITHEKIHSRQQAETMAIVTIMVLTLLLFDLISLWWLLSIPATYYALYGLEYAVRFVMYGFSRKMAYRNISFEQEAYINEADPTYPSRREAFASWKYIFRKTYNRIKV